MTAIDSYAAILQDVQIEEIEARLERLEVGR
jgi:hypothetical protein